MAKSKNDTPNITRIKAKDSGAKKPGLPKPAIFKKQKKDSPSDETPKKVGALKKFALYFKHSWQELRLVRWPDRRSTWKMTGALIIFTVLFGVIILLLDWGFQYLFKLLISR